MTFLCYTTICFEVEADSKDDALKKGWEHLDTYLPSCYETDEIYDIEEIKEEKTEGE